MGWESMDGSLMNEVDISGSQAACLLDHGHRRHLEQRVGSGSGVLPSTRQGHLARVAQWLGSQ